MVNRLLPPFYQVVDANGRPHAGAKLYTYEAGTSTPLATYADVGLTIPNTNPVVADVAGMFPDIFTDDQEYHVLLRTAQDRTISDADPVGHGFGALEIIPLGSFGAVGDGVTDDTAAIAAALAAAQGRTLDGGGRTYKLNSQITSTAERFVLQNAIFDMSALTGTASGLSFAGTEGAATSVTVVANLGDVSLTVGSTAGFVADGYAWLDSTAQWDELTGATLGIMVRVKSVDSATQVTLYEALPYSFSVEGTATLAPLTMPSNIDIDRCVFVGPSGAHSTTLLRFNRCADVTVSRSHFRYSPYSGIAAQRCANLAVQECSFRYFRGSGLGYGAMFSEGCVNGRMVSCLGENLRDLADLGGSAGVNRRFVFANNVIRAGRSFGFNTHPQSDDVAYIGNVIDLDPANAGTIGISHTGGSMVAIGNIVQGAQGGGIIHQCAVNRGVFSSLIQGNRCDCVAGAVGIRTRNNSGGAHDAVLEGVSIVGNTVAGAVVQGVDVDANTGYIEGAIVADTMMRDAATSYGVLLRASSPFTLVDVAVTGGVIRADVAGVQVGTSGGSPGVVAGVSVAPGRVTGPPVNGVAVAAVATGVSVRGGQYNVSGAPVSVVSGAAAVDVDVLMGVQGVSTATATVTLGVTDVICSAGATMTLTLPNPAHSLGLTLNIHSRTAQAVDSASANVIPITGGAAQTAILGATAGSWVRLRSNGTAWIVTAKGS